MTDWSEHIDDLSLEDSRVAAIGAIIHTQEVIDAFAATQQE